MERTLIRYARPEDMDQIVVLCHEHARYEEAALGDYFDVLALSKHIFDSQSIQCLVVQHKEEVVGYATFVQQFSTWSAGFYLYLDCLYLKESLRGRGIGRNLMEEVWGYAKKQGCQHIQWQTPSFNESAIKFYHSLGAKSYSKERFIWEIE